MIVMVRTERTAGFTDTLDTVYEYENEDDIIPSKILHVVSKSQSSTDP